MSKTKRSRRRTGGVRAEGIRISRPRADELEGDAIHGVRAGGIRISRPHAADMPDDRIHKVHATTFDGLDDRTLQECAGQYVIIKDDRVLGISFDRHKLLDEFYHAEDADLPVFYDRIPEQVSEPDPE